MRAVAALMLAVVPNWWSGYRMLCLCGVLGVVVLDPEARLPFGCQILAGHLCGAAVLLISPHGSHGHRLCCCWHHGLVVDVDWRLWAEILLPAMLLSDGYFP